jgi:hypothetical protein
MGASSIVDIPKRPNEEDLFGIDKYKKGLIRFIQNSDTPITIAIQGEWGSGKTSLMNSLQDILCGSYMSAEEYKQHKHEFYSIWVNTWQYSLLRSQEETLINIVTSISTQVLHIIDSRHKTDLQKLSKTVLGLGQKILKVGAASTAEAVAGEKVGDLVGSLLEREQSQQSIKQLRDELQSAICNCLEKDAQISIPKKGFIIFVDDLDRIDPPVAVQILELLKNIFDLHNCIFVLAIDYDVVVKGLKPKFGELTDKNEREFRSFFDKIIQMPFSMPVASYSIDNFLINSLTKIGYLTAANAGNTHLSQHLTTFCNLSVGTNPRSLKRLLNTVSLITIIGKEDESGDQDSEEEYHLLLNFALICIQIAYPALYKTLCMENDFKAWNENLARQLKLRELSDTEKQKLSESDEFDEEWEQIIYRICERDSYLSNKAVQISQMFNLMFKLVPEGEDLGNVISELLTLSSVTDVQAFDKPKQAINKGPVLKTLSASLLPLLNARLRAPWPVVRQQSKKIQSNVYLAFSPESWRDCIGLSVEPVKDYIVLYVWFHPWAFKIKSNDLEVDMKDAGLTAEYGNLKQQYTELSSRYSNVSYKYNPFSRIGTAKGWYVPILTLQIQFSSTEALLDKNALTQTADAIMDFMDQNAKLKELYTEYNKRIS